MVYASWRSHSAKKHGTRSGKPIGSAPVVFRRDHLFELHERGLSVRKIAGELKISPSMVQKVLTAAKTAVAVGN